jgi:hypothetical protein
LFVDFFIRRPVFATVCALLIILAGAVVDDQPGDPRRCSLHSRAACSWSNPATCQD